MTMLQNVLYNIRGRKVDHDSPQVTDVTGDVKAVSETESSGDDLSMEQRNEKEVELHPNEITKGDGPLGVQKAEAAALVWSKNAVYCTYAW
jgi:hypothetical protein